MSGTTLSQKFTDNITSPSGIYLYRVTAQNQRQQREMSGTHSCEKFTDRVTSTSKISYDAIERHHRRQQHRSQNLNVCLCKCRSRAFLMLSLHDVKHEHQAKRLVPLARRFIGRIMSPSTSFYDVAYTNISTKHQHERLTHYKLFTCRVTSLENVLSRHCTTSTSNINPKRLTRSLRMFSGRVTSTSSFLATPLHRVTANVQVTCFCAHTLMEVYWPRDVALENTWFVILCNQYVFARCAMRWVLTLLAAS
jgi:hypothetical protein